MAFDATRTSALDVAVGKIGAVYCASWANLRDAVGDIVTVDVATLPTTDAALAGVVASEVAVSAARDAAEVDVVALWHTAGLVAGVDATASIVTGAR